MDYGTHCNRIFRVLFGQLRLSSVSQAHSCLLGGGVVSKWSVVYIAYWPLQMVLHRNPNHRLEKKLHFEQNLTAEGFIFLVFSRTKNTGRQTDDT